ncbi:hypothetical protein NM688_g1188 [Phlebia brevispora]|uniref:Uncharacterized protein n=1 Tax=Phlebia brevispora TaxID=194682 RepID=A0ACC1TC75_9APHY|nr:hypothetical protein NM688_g1188 [Phlebia brevispora]
MMPIVSSNLDLMTTTDVPNPTPRSPPSATTRNGGRKTGDETTRESAASNATSPAGSGALASAGRLPRVNSVAGNIHHVDSSGIDGPIDQSDSTTEDGEDNASSTQVVDKSKEAIPIRPSREHSIVPSVIIDTDGGPSAPSNTPDPAGSTSDTNSSAVEDINNTNVQADIRMDIAGNSASAGNQPEVQSANGVPTIESVNPRTEALVMKNPGWIPDDVMKRLAVIAARDNPAKFRYALSKVPQQLTVFGGHDSTVLCYQERPLTVLFLARIRSTYFMENGGPARCASVKFKFLREADMHAARVLVDEKSKPPLPASKTFWAGQKNTYWSKATGSSEIRWFSDLYDGTVAIRAKHLMKKLDLDLHTNDIGLFECGIQRYSRGERRPIVWRTWKASFQLQSIVKVYSAPLSAPEEDASDAETSQRDDTDDEDAAY